MKDIEFKRWSSTRNTGITKFVFKTGLLSWGVPMLIVTALLNNPFKDGFFTPIAIAHCLTWTSGGLVFGLLLWFVNELRYKNELAKRNQL